MAIGHRREGRLSDRTRSAAESQRATFLELQRVVVDHLAVVHRLKAETFTNSDGCSLLRWQHREHVGRGYLEMLTSEVSDIEIRALVGQYIGAATAAIDLSVTQSSTLKHHERSVGLRCANIVRRLSTLLHEPDARS